MAARDSGSSIDADARNTEFFMAGLRDGRLRHAAVDGKLFGAHSGKRFADFGRIPLFRKVKFLAPALGLPVRPARLGCGKRRLLCVSLTGEEDRRDRLGRPSRPFRWSPRTKRYASGSISLVL